jgi:hypothetical protein
VLLRLARGVWNSGLGWALNVLNLPSRSAEAFSSEACIARVRGVQGRACRVVSFNTHAKTGEA